MDPGKLTALTCYGVRTLLVLACLPALIGCTPPPAPPAAERLRVVIPFSAAPLFEEIGGQYHARRSYMTIETSERSAAAALKAVARGDADLAFIERDLDPAETLDPETAKPQLRAWPVATGALAIVVHPSNPVQSLTLEQVRLAFTGTALNWADLGGEDRTLQLVSREVATPLREALERKVLRGAAVAGTAVVMPSDEAVAGYVAEHPEAIGYVGAAWAGEGVRAVAIDGARCEPAAVAAGRYPLTYPLVIVTPTAISGKAKDLLDFVYGPDGQAIVGRTYTLPRGD